MRKNYIFGIACLGTFFCKAQLVLTQQTNEPANGDLYELVSYTIGSSPISTGTGQLWNFSNAVKTSTTACSNAYSTPSPSMAGITLRNDNTNCSIGSSGDFYNSVANPSQFELVQRYAPGPTSTDQINYSDPLILYKWPVAYGNTFTDNYSYQFSNIAGNFMTNGTNTVTANGSGTLLLPGGFTYTNVLQIMTVHSLTTTVNSSSPQTGTFTSYEYFQGSQKFPLCSLVVTPNYNQVYINKMQTVGLEEQQNAGVGLIYPNPARDYLEVQINNTHSDNCTLEIYDLRGQKLKTVQLADQSSVKTRISLGDLAPGIYMLVTRTGAAQNVRKLVVEQ